MSVHAMLSNNITMAEVSRAKSGSTSNGCYTDAQKTASGQSNQGLASWGYPSGLCPWDGLGRFRILE
jgi:hypothetical protein